MKIRAALILISGILIMITKNTYSQVLEQDSLALVAFYNSTGGPNWNNNSGWLTGPVSTWYGVTVENRRVIKLEVSSNNINGTIPDEIGTLNKLIKISLSNNSNLTGEIPESIFNIDSLLWLAIGNCSLTGTIPHAIGNCCYLKSISFRENDLTGLIPPEIGNLDSLQHLYLFNNQLTGSIPPELGNCLSLQELDLDKNQLYGSIPPELANLSNLSFLSLSYNQLTGGIPENFVSLFHSNNLSLIVGHNQLTEIPESWGSVYYIAEVLDLSWNNFTYLPIVNYNWLITLFRIEGNKLTFEHIEPHYQSYMAGYYYFFYYEPQDKMGIRIDTVLRLGSSYRIYSGTGGQYTVYQWYRNGELILESADADTLFLENISYADTGIYTCHATNSLIYGFSLNRRPVHITIDTTVHVSNSLLRRKEIQCYPNPASDLVTVIVPESDEFMAIKIFDLNGRCILTKQQIPFSNSHATFRLNGIPEGIYILQIHTNKSAYYSKIIKNNRGADW